MVLSRVHCPHCHSDDVIKGGKTKAGTQRYKCLNANCPHYSFQLDLIYKGRCPEIKEQIIDMALNGSGIWHTPSDFVVDQEASNAESGLYREILLLDNVWTTFCRLIRDPI